MIRTEFSKKLTILEKPQFITQDVEIIKCNRGSTAHLAFAKTANIVCLKMNFLMP